MIETMRSSVQTWECDMNAHMNVQFYVGHAENGLAALGHALGLGLPRDRGAGLVVYDHHIRFQRERRPGDPILMETGVLAIESGEVVVYQEMRASATGEVAATFISRCRWTDLRSRATLSLPACVAERALVLGADLPEYAKPRGASRDTPRPSPRLEQAEALGLEPTYTGLVAPQDGDGYGFMLTRGFMARVSDAVPVLIAATPGLQRGIDSGMGGAALEYRFVYRAAPRVGDILTLRSGLKGLGGKTYTWCHWMFDRTSGACVASAEAVVVSLDLDTRRAVALPDDVRTSLQSRVIDRLSV